MLSETFDYRVFPHIKKKMLATPKEVLASLKGKSPDSNKTKYI